MKEIGKEARNVTCKEGEGGALHGSSIQQAWAHATRPEPCDHPRGVGPVGGTLPCDVGQEVHSMAAGWLLLCQRCDSLVIQPKRLPHLQTIHSMLRSFTLLTCGPAGDNMDKHIKHAGTQNETDMFQFYVHPQVMEDSGVMFGGHMRT